MKVLVQDKETKMFFVDQNTWTNDPASAHNFARISKAVDFCREFKLSTASVVILSKELKFTTRFDPLSPGPRPSK
jgi:hypothetical protein